MRRRASILFAGLLIGTLTAAACRVPVFRYALERWVADSYRVQILHRGGLDDSRQAAVEELQAAGANVEIRPYDLNALTEAQQWQLDDVPDDAELPLLRVLPPGGAGSERVLWEGAATTNALSMVIDSPLRSMLVGEIASGVSAVWVVVPGSSPERTMAMEARLRRDLIILQKTMELPEGVIDAGSLEHASQRPDEPIDLDDVLRSHIPLKLDFAVRRLDRSDPAEQLTVAMLAPLLPDGADGGVIPVFGRGRALPGMTEAQLTMDRLERACAYIAGSCSCQVKAENPGIDLLMKADWNALLNDQLIVAERELPPLEGVAVVTGETEEKPSPAVEAGEVAPVHSLKRNMLVVGGVFVCFVVLGTLWSHRKSV